MLFFENGEVIPSVNKKNRLTGKRFFLFGWMMGFEPTTLGTTIQCSNQLSYNHHVFAGANIIFYFFEIQKMNQ